MALSLQDILKGIDFTGLSPATGADFNQLVDLAAPVLDTAAEGKGLNLWTADSALNTPIVPNPLTSASYNKWKRYVWIRKLHSSAGNVASKAYVWNDDATSVATYLKWREITTDLTAIQADVATALADAAAAQVTADNAASVATVANTNANAASITATAANTTAINAATAAITAQASANEALADAEAAAASATNAQTTATAAQNTANTAQALASVNRKNKYLKITYRGATEQPGTANQWNRLPLDTEVHDEGNLATLAANVITLNAGTYFVDAFVPCYDLRTGMLMVGNDSDTTVLLKGADTFFAGAHAQVLRLTGFFTIAAVKNISLYLIASNNGNIGYGDGAAIGTVATGLPAGYAAPASVAERYQIEFFKLD